MTKPSPAMIKVLREAKFFGDLVERDGKIYSRRSEQPFCSKATVDANSDKTRSEHNASLSSASV